MRVTLRQIEAFYWVAKLGTVRSAAQHLHVSQPAVTARIQELEEVLGVPLFARQRQRVELSARGRSALSYAERVLGASQDFERLGSGFRALEGVLRLGADESASMVGLTQILTQLKALHPQLKVELSIELGTVLIEKLRKRELDIALHTNAGAGSHVVDELIGWVEFQWMASQDMETPPGDFLPEHAVTLPIVTHLPPSTLNSAVQKWLRAGGFDFDRVHSCNSLSLILRLVRASHAVAILPVAILRDLLASGELRVLPARPALAPTPYYASYLDDERGEDMAAVIEIAKAVLHDARFFQRLEAAAFHT